jgi:predicted AlkP superfamily phosphohydrolase/phosphomutase
MHHFMWEHMEKGDPKYAPEFLKVYRRIDDILGELRTRLAGKATLVVVSDHGFCTVKKEVYLNHWLEQNGWLRFTKASGVGLKDIEGSSRAYSLTPGRIYVNLQGREPRGSVAAGAAYEKVRQELIDSLTGLRDPDSGEMMIERVVRREELFPGEAYEAAPDLVVLPFDGYDLKGDLNKPKLTDKGALVGMHTYGDAILSIEGVEPRKDQLNIADAMPTLLGVMGLPIPPGLDGGDLR